MVMKKKCFGGQTRAYGPFDGEWLPSLMHAGNVNI